MKIYIFVITCIVLFLSQGTTASAQGFTDTKCYHNGEHYKSLLGDKICPAFEEVHETPLGNCTIMHEANSKSSMVSSKLCVTLKDTTVLHCTLAREVNDNDIDPNF